MYKDLILFILFLIIFAFLLRILIILTSFLFKILVVGILLILFFFFVNYFLLPKLDKKPVDLRAIYTLKIIPKDKITKEVKKLEEKTKKFISLSTSTESLKPQK